MFEIEKMEKLELDAFKDKVINSMLSVSEKNALYEAIEAREVALDLSNAFIDDGVQI